MIHFKVLNIIRTLRDSHPQMTRVFSEGSCLNFFCLLKQIFPQAEAWDDANHIITEIDGRYYDITGEVEKTTHTLFRKTYARSVLNEVFDQMYNTEPQINMEPTNIHQSCTYNVHDQYYTQTITANGAELINETSKDQQGLEYLMLYRVHNVIKELEGIRDSLDHSIEEHNEIEVDNDISLDHKYWYDYDNDKDKATSRQKMRLIINGKTVLNFKDSFKPIDEENEEMDADFFAHIRDIHKQLGGLLYEWDQVEKE